MFNLKQVESMDVGAAASAFSKATVLLLLAPLAVSCTAAPKRTAVVAVVDSDRAVQERAIDVRITVRGGRGGSSTWLEVYDQQLEPIEWPFSMSLVPAGGDASRGYEVTISVRDRDGEFSRVRAISSYVPGRVITLPLFLEAKCIDVDCRDNQTCEVQNGDAVCVDAEVGAGQLEVIGVADAGASDAAWDGGMDALFDAGRDEGATLDAAATLEAAPADSSPEVGPPDPPLPIAQIFVREWSFTDGVGFPSPDPAPGAQPVVHVIRDDFSMWSASGEQWARLSEYVPPGEQVQLVAGGPSPIGGIGAGDFGILVLHQWPEPANAAAAFVWYIWMGNGGGGDYNTAFMERRRQDGTDDGVNNIFRVAPLETEGGRCGCEFVGNCPGDVSLAEDACLSGYRAQLWISETVCGCNCECVP